MKLADKYKTGAELVIDSFSPRILVISTPKTDEIAKRTGFDNFSDLLKPFGEDVQINSRIIDGEGSSFYLDSVSIKFVDDCGNKRETIPTKNELSDWINSTFDEGTLETPKTVTQPPFPYPWYKVFANNWINSIGETSFQAFEHPIITLFVASLEEENPYSGFKELLTHPLYDKARKSLYNGGEMIVYYLLVSHKDSPNQIKSNQEERKAVYSELAKRLGSNTAFLEILSSSTDISDKELISSQDSQEMSINMFNEEINILPESIVDIKRAVKQIISEGMISHMQRQILLLGEQTSSVRKGITGRLFSAGRKYFSSSNKLSTKSTDDYGEVFYLRGSIEMKLRKLADYFFMLKGYRVALPVYTVASREFLSDKSWKCYAGSQEMIGICRLLQDKKQAKDQFDQYLKNALESYKKSVWQSDLYSFRSIILYSEICFDIECYQPAVSILLLSERTTNSICAALFLENACQISTFLGLFRKANLYNHLAAIKYNAGNQPQHSYRCYKLEKNSHFLSLWKKSDAETSSLMSVLSVKLGDTNQSLECYERLINNVLLDESKQSYNMQELCRIYTLAKDNHDLTDFSKVNLDLTFPIFKKESIRLYLSPENDGIDSISRWPQYGGEPVPRESANKAFCSPNELVTILIVVENPLKIQITLNDITLLCSLEDENGERYCTEPICEKIESFSLEPQSQSMLSIKINAPSKGTIYIKDVQYLLNGSILQKRSLSFNGARLNETSEQRSNVVYKDEYYPCIKVLPSLPYLLVKMMDFPDSLISGQIIKSVISIKNVSNIPVDLIYIWTSHPSFFYVDGANSKDSKNRSLSDDEKDNFYFNDTNLEDVFSYSIGNKIMEIPSKKIVFETPLCPGDDLEIPLWVRGDKIGSFSFKFMVGYPHMSPEFLLSNEKRTFLMEEICDINPSLQINVNLKSIDEASNIYILTLNIENPQQTETFILNQASFSCPIYDVFPLSNIPDKIQPLQKVSLNYYVKAPPELKFSSLLPTERFTADCLQNYIDKNSSELNGSSSTNLSQPDIKIKFFNFNHAGNPFIRIEKSPLCDYLIESRSNWRLYLLRQHFQQLSIKDISIFFGLYDSFSIECFLFWEVEGKRGCFGHHSVKGIKSKSLVYEGAISVGEQEASESLLKSNTNREQILVGKSIIDSLYDWSGVRDEFESKVLVKMKLQGSQGSNYVYYSDGATFPITISVIANLENLMWGKSYNYKLNLIENRRVVIDSRELNKNMSPVSNTSTFEELGIYTNNWGWAGKTEICGKILPGSANSAELKVIIYTPGSINLNNWNLKIWEDRSGSSNRPSGSDVIETIMPTIELPIWVL
ncbi:Transport protein particle subunit trs85-2 [Smittium mucronatum]|uniref:Transport protein particle subunit trs85-2 n=1 Tax=Smittium mucronatum TaxID=133383 RepID=A0A1R0GWD1_9FUNG|nr:Transport protein particle subunit trs85-2 [Smittium mucronatum]